MVVKTSSRWNSLGNEIWGEVAKVKFVGKEEVILLVTGQTNLSLSKAIHEFDSHRKYNGVTKINFIIVGDEIPANKEAERLKPKRVLEKQKAGGWKEDTATLGKKVEVTEGSIVLNEVHVGKKSRIGDYDGSVVVSGSIHLPPHSFLRTYGGEYAEYSDFKDLERRDFNYPHPQFLSKELKRKG